MRRTLVPVVLSILIAAVAGWLWFGREDPSPGPSPGPDPHEQSAVTGGDPELERAPIADRSAQRDAPIADSPGPEPASATSPTPPVGPPPNLELLVRSSRTRAALPQFRYSFRHRGGIVRGEGQDGATGIALPPRMPGELLVEADGHVPFATTLAAPPPEEPARALEVFLDEAAAATGIEITAVDLGGAPIPNVRVDAWRLPEGAGIGSWHRGAPLWSRRTGATDGRYVLPELSPGDYGVRLLATDADGELLPMLPFARTFALTGSNGFVEHAVLEPGCVLGVELVDAAGAPLDPKRSSIALELRLAGGPEISRRWIQTNERGRFAADDAPPASGTCWLDEAVAAGFYRLTVTIDGVLRHEQQLALRIGERQHERVVIP